MRIPNVILAGLLAVGTFQANAADLTEEQVRMLKSSLEVDVRKKKADRRIDSSREGILKEITEYIYVITIANRGSEPLKDLDLESLVVVEKAPAVGALRGKDPKISTKDEELKIPEIPARDQTILETKPVESTSSRVRSGYAFDEAGVSNISNDDVLGCVIRIKSGDTVILEKSNPPSLAGKLKKLVEKKK